jgi:Na+/proline symporter
MHFGRCGAAIVPISIGCLWLKGCAGIPSLLATRFTIPEFFNSRFHDKKNLIMGVAGVFILIFFSVYAQAAL